MKRTEMLEEALAEKTFDNIALTCRLARAEDVARDLDEHIEYLKAENERHKNMISSLTIMLQSKIDLIEEQEKEIYEFGEDNNRLMSKFDDALFRISELEDRLSER